MRLQHPGEKTMAIERWSVENQTEEINKIFWWKLTIRDACGLRFCTRRIKTLTLENGLETPVLPSKHNSNNELMTHPWRDIKPKPNPYRAWDRYITYSDWETDHTDSMSVLDPILNLYRSRNRYCTHTGLGTHHESFKWCWTHTGPGTGQEPIPVLEPSMNLYRFWNGS